MAIYHMSVKIIGRSAGRSSVAAAAYRAGEDLINEYDGIEHDFRRKNWVAYTKIMLPENAPEAYADRSTLWNAVEAAEKSKDAQLAREFEIALPVELSREDQIGLVEKFARDELISQGMIADIAIHDPPVVNDRHQPIDENGDPTADKDKMQFHNPHAHILCTMRPMDEKGRWAAKSTIEYLCIRNGEERGFTAEEYKDDRSDGWEKQYRYDDGGKKVWLTADEGRERGLERVSRSPRTTPYGRKNKTAEYWNAAERVPEWRSAWERTVNDKFLELHSDIRIDSRSFKDQGREDELPTLHMGPSAVNMERRAERKQREGRSESKIRHSDIGSINREIRAHNRYVREIRAKIDRMIDSGRALIDRIAAKLEGLRAKIIGNTYEGSVIQKSLSSIDDILVPEGERISNYESETDKLRTADKEAAADIASLKAELAAMNPLSFRRRKQLQDRIREIQMQIEYRSDYMQRLGQMYDLHTDQEYKEAKRRLEAMEAASEKLHAAVDRITADTDQLVKEYRSESESIPDDMKDEVNEKCIAMRGSMEAVVIDNLIKEYGEAFDARKLETARSTTDKKLIGSAAERKTESLMHSKNIRR